MLTAKEAMEETKKQIRKNYNETLMEVDDAIHEAIKEGKYSAYIRCDIQEEIISLLESEEYGYRTELEIKGHLKSIRVRWDHIK